VDRNHLNGSMGLDGTPVAAGETRRRRRPRRARRHVTLIRGEGPLVVGEGPVRTGLTAVLPRPDSCSPGTSVADLNAVAVWLAALPEPARLALTWPLASPDQVDQAGQLLRAANARR
jgi:hypothetical protein